MDKVIKPPAGFLPVAHFTTTGGEWFVCAECHAFVPLTLYDFDHMKAHRRWHEVNRSGYHLPDGIEGRCAICGRESEDCAIQFQWENWQLTHPQPMSY